MYQTDLAIRIPVNGITGNYSCESGTSTLDTIKKSILPSIQSKPYKVINFHGNPGTGKSRLAAYCAGVMNWPIYAPQKQVAPLQRLLFGRGIKLSFELLTDLSDSQDIIVIDTFDKVKSKEQVLLASQVSSGRFILITHNPLPDEFLRCAGIHEYLSIEFTTNNALPSIQECRVNRNRSESLVHA